jgi:tetratricopeptide (TPR) repeat protein
MEDPIKIIQQSDEIRDQGKGLDKAILLLEELLEEVRKDPIILSFYIPLIMKKLGNLYRDIGDIKKAKETYQEALDTALNDLNRTEESDIFASMAFLELKTGDIEKALKYARKAEKNICPKRGKKFAEAKSNTYAVLGNIYFEKGEYEEAMDAYRRGLIVAEDAEYVRREITILNDMANIYIYKGHYFNAEKKLRLVLEKAEANYRIALPQVYLRLGKMYMDRDEFEKSKEYIDKALESAKELGLKGDIEESEEALEVYLKAVKS